MKNYIIAIALLFAANFCSGQKYVLIDKTMVDPIMYTDDVSLKNTYKDIFVVETIHFKEFVSALAEISNRFINDDNKIKGLNFKIGSTKITSLPITVMKEDRLDITMSTYTKEANVSMHLSDAKNNNAQNLFFINSWIKYIKSYAK